MDPLRTASSRGIAFLVLSIGLGFLILPIVVIFMLSLHGGDFLTLPPDPVSLRWYAQFAQDRVWTDAIRVSVVVGVAAASLAVAVGTPAAWFFAHRSDLATRGLYFTTISPIVVPPIVLAIGSYVAYSTLKLQGSYVALVLTHAVLGVPFAVVLGTIAIARLDKSVEWAARSLGANPVKVMILVTLPRLFPTIAAAWAFAFLISLDEVVITTFLLPLGVGPTLPMQIYVQLQYALTPEIAAVSAFTVVAAFVFTVFLGRRLVRGTAAQ